MDMTMSSAAPSRVEVVTSVQRRRRWTPEQKLEIVKQTTQYSISASISADLNHHVGLVFDAQSRASFGCGGQVRISAGFVKDLGCHHGGLIVYLPDRDTAHKSLVFAGVSIKIRTPLVVSIVVVLQLNDQE